MPDSDATPAEEKDRGLHRAGPLNPDVWDEQKAVTGRKPDEAPANSTFSSRASKPVVEDTKQDPDEDKAVRSRSRGRKST
jgi:hypothetical protein